MYEKLSSVSRQLILVDVHSSAAELLLVGVDIGRLGSGCVPTCRVGQCVLCRVLLGQLLALCLARIPVLAGDSELEHKHLERFRILYDCKCYF